MIYLLYTLHIILCIFLILVVLLQQGKGADLSVFGGGATMTAFGARSATNMLHKLTVGGFVGFVLTTVSIAYVQSHFEGGSVMSGARTKSTAPAQNPANPPAQAPASAPAKTPASTPAPASGATGGATAPSNPAPATPDGGTPSSPPPAN